MHTSEKAGQTWTIYGKEITPVMNVYSNGNAQRSKTGGFGYAWAYLRPVRFVVRDGGEERRINIPAINSPALAMAISMISMPFLAYSAKKAFAKG